MDDTLSSLIAFVGFLIVFSMLIQSVQEALKNLFKLKAGVWERFFINLYSIDFTEESMMKAKPFWKRVGKDSQFVGEFQQRLMRLKKIIFKADDYIKELKPLLTEIDNVSPEDKDVDISPKIESVYEIMGKVDGLKVETVLRIYDEKKRLEKKEGEPENKKASKDGPVKQFTKKFSELYHSFEQYREMSFDAARDKCGELAQLIREFEKDLSTYRIQLENKADSWLVQLEGEYKKDMLKWTLFISVAAVIILNADAFSIYKYFSVNSETQEIMIESVTSSISKINESRADSLNEINSALKADDPGLAGRELQDLASQIKNEFVMMDDEFNAQAAEKILASARDASGKPEEQAEVKNLLGELTRLYLTLQKSSIDYHLSGLEATGLPLGWGYDWQTLKNIEGCFIPACVVKKIFGLLLTIFLVSFGAPFWQNVMNALINFKNLSKRSGTGGAVA